MDNFIQEYPFVMQPKIKLAIELYEIVHLLNDEVIIDKEIIMKDSFNRINRIFIKKKSGVYFWQELRAETVTFKRESYWDKDIVNMLTLKKMLEDKYYVNNNIDKLSNNEQYDLSILQSKTL